jgi:phospholipase/lecithinase/hemolysin
MKARLYTGAMPSYFSRFFYSASLLAAMVSSAQAGSFSSIYAFGDSLSDAGNAFLATGIPAAPYSNGRFTNGNVWVQDLAANLGLPAVTPSLAGGTDFAVGGAQSGTTPFYTAALGDLPSQLAAFQLANPGGANTNGLYTIWIGSNDLRAILATNPTPAQAAVDVAAVAANVDKAINFLAADGAKNFLILTVPDLGKSPAAIATGPLGVAAASALSFTYDNLLVNGGSGIPSLGSLASADGVKLSVLDTFSLIDGIVAQPAKFGFTDVTDQCLVGAVNYAGGTPCANPSQYLFWDQLHPTAAGASIVASFAQQAIPEPATVTMIGVGVLAGIVVRRRSRVA